MNHENDNTELTPSLIPVNVCETSDTNHVTPADAISSLPGSRAQSPLNGLGRCNRISESSCGSVSLPSTPLSTRTKSPEFFDTKTSRKTSRNGSRTVSPTGDATGRKTPTTKVSLKPNKSATVDLGMLRRTSSSPEIDVPVKEKRGEGQPGPLGLFIQPIAFKHKLQTFSRVCLRLRRRVFHFKRRVCGWKPECYRSANAAAILNVTVMF